MSDLLGGDIFGDPAPKTEKSSEDIFQSAVSDVKEPNMQSVSLDSPPAVQPAVPTPVTVPVAMMEPVAPATVISAAPSVPDTPVGASANDLFSDVDVKTEKRNGGMAAASDVTITVCDPRKAGDGVGAFIAYTLKTETTRAKWNGKSFEVTRRFSDFLGLYEKLAGKYQHKGFFILPAPEKSITSFTKVKIGTDDDQFVQRRQQSLQRWLRAIVRHHALTLDPDLQMFLTQDNIPPATSTRALSTAGVLRFMGKVENAITKQVQQKMPETDSWFDERAQQVDALQNQLRRLVGSAGNLSVHRRELAISSGDLGRASAMLANTEEKQVLSRSLSNLGTLYENLGEIYCDLSDKDLYSFSELLADQVRGLDGIRNILSAREKMWQNWQTSEQGLLRKRENVTRLQATGRTEKIPGAELEIKEWESRAQMNRKAFEDMSNTAKQEMNHWESQRVQETRQFLIQWMKDMLVAERKVVKLWEQYLPKAQEVQ